MKRINVIGAGLAGSEALSYLLKRGYDVHLYERRPLVDDGAHVTPFFGELVCSNSLKAKQLDNACGLLKEEMRKMDSITMADAIRVADIANEQRKAAIRAARKEREERYAKMQAERFGHGPRPVDGVKPAAPAAAAPVSAKPAAEGEKK